jgi:hypothetical protein
VALVVVIEGLVPVNQLWLCVVCVVVVLKPGEVEV